MLFRRFSRFGGGWRRGFDELPFYENAVFRTGVDVGSTDGDRCYGVR